MLDNYISKVKIGSTVYPIGDKIARETASNALSTAESKVAGIDNDHNLAFKIDGNYYSLQIDNAKQIKIAKIVYNAPTISIENFKWNGSSTTSYSVDAPNNNTNSVTGAVAGTLTVSDGQMPTCATSGVEISAGSDTNTYTIGGNVTIANNGSAEFIFTTKGATINPSGTYDYASTSKITISRTSTVASGIYYYASDVTPVQNITGGFKFNFDNVAVTPTTQTFKDNTTVTLTFPSTIDNGYIYIFTNAAKSFVMSTDKATVDSSKLGGGVIELGTVKTYSIEKPYYIYRSLNSFAKNTNVYVKSIV